MSGSHRKTFCETEPFKSLLNIMYYTGSRHAAAVHIDASGSCAPHRADVEQSIPHFAVCARSLRDAGLFYKRFRRIFMTNINCSKNCVYQKDGKCGYDSILLQKTRLSGCAADCAYQVTEALQTDAKENSRKMP